MNFSALRGVLRDVDETHRTELDAAVSLALRAKHDRARVFFIGNGGSAAIASHCAADWLKNGRFVASCFNDGAALTCLANDLGYEFVFAEPLTLHGRDGDLLFAISSSGQSENIIKGVRAAVAQRLNVVTLSGFKPDNPLRSMGALNFYVPSERYGHVEIAHLAILHAVLDRVTELA